MKKRLAGLLVSAVMALSVLTGCGSSGDADAYTKGVLDIAYHKGTEEYVKVTGAKKADAEKYMEQSMEAQSKALAVYFGIENPSDTVIEAFTPAAEKICELVDYEVEADGDKVIVEAKGVEVKPGEEAKQYLDDYNVKRFVDGDTSCTDESFAKGMAELLVKELESAKDTETTTVEITVTEKDGSFHISDEDMIKVDEALISYE